MHLQIAVEISADGTVHTWNDDHSSPAEVTVLAMTEDFEPVVAAAERRRIEQEHTYAEQLEQWRVERRSVSNLVSYGISHKSSP
jgi:hypothetical protein